MTIIPISPSYVLPEIESKLSIDLIVDIRQDPGLRAVLEMVEPIYQSLLSSMAPECDDWVEEV